MQCVTFISFSIKFNGESLPPFFQPSRGLHQGDPLSPYLSILFANVLSLLMKKAIEKGRFKGIKLHNKCPTLSHLLFVYDSIFFLDGKVRECQQLVDIFNQYRMVTGQAIKLNKSETFFSSGCP